LSLISTQYTHESIRRNADAYPVVVDITTENDPCKWWTTAEILWSNEGDRRVEMVARIKKPKEICNNGTVNFVRNKASLLLPGDLLLRKNLRL
jgi:hypothetical protein